MNFSFISRDDIDVLFRTLGENGGKRILEKLKLRTSSRIKSQWDNYEASGSNWWDIPEVQRRWNMKISGKPDLDWIRYVVEKYASSREKLSLLSIGCGTGDKERTFAAFPNFSEITGVDISEKSIAKAWELAQKNNFNQIEYLVGDFSQMGKQLPAFDFVLFYSSLHHFTNIQTLLHECVIPALKPEGFLVIFEYTGPNRFQYPSLQLVAANRGLKLLPAGLRMRKDFTLKQKVYRPGWLRMFLNDPSEAPQSESILPVLRREFKCVEEKPVGGALLHPLLKDIGHHFSDEEEDSMRLLRQLFEDEDAWYAQTGQSDFWFGVYQRKG